MTRAILFDFDGTLADTAPGIVLTMQKTFAAMGLPEPAPAAIRATIGLPLRECVRLLGGLDETAAEAGAATYRSLFPVYELGRVGIFPGVPQTLELLARRGYRMAVCTSRNKFSLDSLLQRHGLQHFFDAVVTGDTHPHRPKPAPDMALFLMERLAAGGETTWVVGDTTFDIDMGNNARCTTVAVTYGNHSRERLRAAGPDHMIDRFGDLADLLP